MFSFVCMLPMPVLNADLHCHSTVSDGVFAPDVLARRAHAQGVQLWALTDHDEVGGIALARQTAQALGMSFLTGVEISVTWANKTIHIVGLNFDEYNPELLAGLQRTRSGRQQRAEQMARDLAAVGIPDAYRGALKYVGNPDLISRSHFARYIVELGVCPDVSTVFKHYLADGKPGFVPHRWASLADAVTWIRQAGGVAVIAHPGRYDLSPVAFDALVNEFKQLGGTGIEVVTGSHTPDQYQEYTKIANAYGLCASRGSDFHAPDDHTPDLGQLPALAKELTPIWRALISS